MKYPNRSSTRSWIYCFLQPLMLSQFRHSSKHEHVPLSVIPVFEMLRYFMVEFFPRASNRFTIDRPKSHR
jgi:hypothetical protein